jgi:plastocyanin domain-containing protein
MQKRLTAKRLRDIAVVAAVRGAAGATGSGVVGVIVWWITRH